MMMRMRSKAVKRIERKRRSTVGVDEVYLPGGILFRAGLTSRGDSWEMLVLLLEDSRRGGYFFMLASMEADFGEIGGNTLSTLTANSDQQAQFCRLGVDQK